MEPRLKGKKYEVCYRCPGYQKPFYERFDTIEEANLRIAEIELDKKRGCLYPPIVNNTVQKNRQKNRYTLSDLLDDYVSTHGSLKWGHNYYSHSVAQIENYIKPYIGSVPVAAITTAYLNQYYSRLLNEPAKLRKCSNGEKTLISASVIEKIHRLLRSAFNYAISIDMLSKNPATNATVPEYKSKKLPSWSTAESKVAIANCGNPILELCLVLAMGCSLRIGEVLGLRWQDLHMEPALIAKKQAYIEVSQILSRIDKSAIAHLQRSEKDKISFIFPECKTANAPKTSLVLKQPKTETSSRKIYIADTIIEKLNEAKSRQDTDKKMLGAAYQDFDMVITHENGRPYEERQIRQLLEKHIKDNQLRNVVFHSLRHSSTSLKLQLSNGDIKTVQGDTGHAQAKMVTEVYAEIFDEDRQMLAQAVEGNFFSGVQDKDNEGNVEDEKMRKALNVLQEHPELSELIVRLASG